MSVLEKINSSNDVKKLNDDELMVLCDELRRKIVYTVSETGGHLASNLGAVELTVALHRVYDSSKDRIVFDVGHQCYCHKIITGRRDSFSTLRQFGGISGFPKPYESEDDAFIAGHASTSVSVAVGMARSRTLLNSDYDVVCVIGDGALTGGTALEGIAAAASSGEPLVIILNDNNMSISKNVGGVANMLRDMRIRPAYLNFKRAYRAAFKKIPILYRFNHRIKEKLKRTILPSNLFSSFGLEYLGPIDGHNVFELERAIKYARELRQPVVLHVLTLKGKGYKYAVESPDKFHGVGKFNILTGDIYNSAISFSDVLGEELCNIALSRDDVVAITAAMPGGTGLETFEDSYPSRFFDIGIAEESAVAMAAGMAKQGLIPVFAIYSTFLQRAYDMLIHDVGLSNLHVVLAVDRAGIVGNDGETHQGLFDVSFLRSVPNMTIYSPASFDELREMLCFSIEKLNGPVAIRYPRGTEGIEYNEVHMCPTSVLLNGNDITIISYGVQINRCIKACEILNNAGISAELIKLNRLTQIDFLPIIESVIKTKKIIIVEDTCQAGSIGEEICTEILRNNIKIDFFKQINFGKGIVESGDCNILYKKYGLDADSIAHTAITGVTK